jgi:tetratricopeptide (TPR) repeat protein
MKHRDAEPAENRGGRSIFALLLLTGVLCLAGCGQKAQDSQRRYADAKALFDEATKQFHMPSGEATGSEQARLQAQAIVQYRRLLNKYPEQEYWCAETLCSLGNIYAAQNNLSAALRCWSEVVAKYPRQEWDVLMALKSSADGLWNANRKGEAKPFYQKIVSQFDQTNAPQAVLLIVKGSKAKLEEKD